MLRGGPVPGGRAGPGIRSDSRPWKGRNQIIAVRAVSGYTARNEFEEQAVSKEELVHLEGDVILIAKGGNFRVRCDNGHEVLAKLAGKVRRHRIRVVLGDRVTVAVSPYDPNRGFIVYRQR